MTPSPRVLVVDDDQGVLDLVVEFLRAGGFEVDGVRSVDAGLELFHPLRHSLVISDLQMHGRDGFDLLRSIRKQTKCVPIILLTGAGTIQTAVDAIKNGAFDFVTKPIEMQHLLELATRAIDFQRIQTENENLRSEVSALRGTSIAPVGSSLGMKKVLELARAVASTDSTILITGESGTGKEVLANTIQQGSARRAAAFIKVNCAALSATLLESELFGHEKGSFSGALDRHIGRFELAQNGTIFLDEIGEMNAGAQTRLLRIIQQRELQRVGGSATIKLNIRIICATNRDLSAEVAAGRFREDLFYRINVFPLHLPPLRERRGDIPALVVDLLKSTRQRVGRGPSDVSQGALDCLTMYDWPGNIRELENVLERCSILCPDVMLRELDLPSEVFPLAAAHESAPIHDEKKSDSLTVAVADSERRKIVTVLEQCRWNVASAARKLGISRSTLYEKLSVYCISRNA